MMSELEKEIKDKKYTQYADDIISGKIPSCKYVKMACERYLSWFEKDDRYFDAEAVEKVITFISKLKHFTGKYNNQPFLLEPWQKFIIYNLFGWKKKKDNLRLIRNFYLELGRKNGKALDISTKIPTPNGYTTMGDLKVGDEVFDKDGNITKVTFVTPIKYNHKCYEVTFSDGEKIIADEEHNWLVDRWHRNNFHVETTKEIIDKGYDVVTVPLVKGKGTKEIVAIRAVKSVPVRCITVDSPSHTYLCGEKMTVTHNTSLVAAIFLYLLICDGEANPSLILSANSFRQSQIMYSMCSNYLRSIDQKGKYFRRYRDRILFPKNDGKIQTVASEPQKLDGENCSAFACDELHEAVDSKMWDVLATSCGSRDQSLGVAVTTAGFNKNGYCYQFRKSNIEVLEGKKTDDTLFCLIYTLDDEDDWCDESNWIKANPNLNVSVKEEFIEQQVNQAQNNPTQEVSVRTKLLNQWLDSSSSWIPMSFVDKSFAKVELEEFRDEYCYVGVDLGSVSDLTAVSVMIPKDDKIYVKNWAFVPEAAMDGTPNSMRYRQFRNQGDLIVTDGNVCDYDRIIKLLEEIQEVCPIRKIAYDQWNATQWAIEMTEKGFPLLPFSQSISSMNRPIKELQRLFLQGKIILDNNQVTRFCLGNCVAVIDNHENVALGKESYEQKIDVAVAMADAVGSYLSENHYDGSLIDAITF
jgi:phage terminase large subunit-like protein